ncbi:MAG TPA: hypothetical protein VHM25_14245, partial [Polyangiaceae bacterium]|nr:hypothetical protein [Polyangiaceae bacterium]
MTKFRTGAVLFGWFASLSVFSCTENIEVGRNHASGAGNGGAASNAAGASAAGTSAAGASGSPPHTCQPAACQGKVYDCGDCDDNDRDGLTDSDDPECTGPCDNTEDSYYGGIPGQNN